MATAATQTGRNLVVSTPLGDDVLLALEFHAEESMSNMFEATVDVQAEKSKDVAFDKLLGKPIIVGLAYPGNQEFRHFHGICNRMSQGPSNVDYTRFRLHLAPAQWLLTKRLQCRAFQQINVPDILKQVFTGFEVSYQLQGTFEPRDYCIQYRESDWDFAVRLMEEEGIYYYFKHSANSHQMVIANTPQSHPDVPFASTITYKNVAQAPTADEDFIYEFGKSQEVTAGKIMLWDHCFEMPDKHLEVTAKIQDAVQIGQVSHKLGVADNGQLELFDYPGEFAQRFDGIDPGGGERPGDIQKIFSDGERTAKLRMEQEAAGSIRAEGLSTCRQLSAGYKFSLATVASDPLTTPLKAAGSYVITSVAHFAKNPDAYRSQGGEAFQYNNSFSCMPASLPYRPPREYLKPVMPGAQTATVVGPSGEEIFTDKYGRVKVQFHWDRQGKFDPNSACWVRVAVPWAGQNYGMVSIPRIGQEVIVDFLEGDPDQPIITGSVYNAQQMPPFGLPDSRMISGMKSNSYPGGGGFHQMTFDDTKGKELMRTHAQKDQTITVGNDRSLTVNNNETVHIVGNRTETVDKHETVTIKQGRELTISKGDTITIDGGRDTKVTGKEAEKITGDQVIEVTAAASFKSKTRIVNVEGEEGLTAGGPTTYASTKDLKISSDSKILLVVGGSSIEITPAGITISTKTFKADGSVAVEISGAMIKSSAKGTHDITGALVKIN